MYVCERGIWGERRIWGVCVEGSKVVFEEMSRVLKNLVGGSKMAGLPKIWIK